MGTRETSLTKKIEKYWKEKGSYVVKFHGNNFTQQGVPDLIICYEGSFIGIEVKVGENAPTPIQLEHLKRISKWYGGYGIWVNENNWLKKSEEIIGLIKFKNIEMERREY